MLLRQLEYLVAVAREGHFGRAADACAVSQPALSAGIRKLELELDVQIVQRGQRFEGLTPEGTEVLRWAQRILAERAVLGHRLTGMRGELAGVLRIGAIPTALTAAPLLTTPMHEQHPLVRFTLQSMSSREIVARLNDFDIDIGMTYVDGEPLGQVRVVPLYHERYFFLTPADGPFAAHDRVSWAQAGSTDLCLLGGTMQNRRIIEGYLAEAGIEPTVVVETDTTSAIYSHVTALGLSSIIPHAWLHRFGLPDGVRLLPLPRPRRSFQVGLVLAGRHPASLLAQAMVDIAAQVDLQRALNDAVAPHLK